MGEWRGTIGTVGLFLLGWLCPWPSFHFLVDQNVPPFPPLTYFVVYQNNAFYPFADEIMQEFRSGGSRLLIATDVWGRGLDFQQVS